MCRGLSGRGNSRGERNQEKCLGWKCGGRIWGGEMSKECPGNCLEGGILGVKGTRKNVWGGNVEEEFGGGKMSEECPGNCLEGGILGVKGSGKYVWGENVEGEFGGHEMSEEMSVQEKTVQSKKLGGIVPGRCPGNI